MVTIKALWAHNHTTEQSELLNAFCITARDQGKLKRIEFSAEGVPTMTFVDDASADKFVELITTFNPTEIIRQ